MSDTRGQALSIDDAGFCEAYGAAWSSGDENWLAEYFAADGRYVEAAMGATYVGAAEVARFFRFMLAFSSDSSIKFTSLIRQDESFAAEWRWSGTSDGPLVVDGTVHEASGRRYDVSGVAVCKIRGDGLIVHHKDYYDVRTLVAQVTC